MRNRVTIIAVALVVASTAAMAGGKGGGGRHVSSSEHPSEGVTLSYGKVNQTYTQQRRDLAAGQANGKRQYKPVHVVKEWGAASPMLRGNNSNNRKGGRYLAKPQ